MVTFQVVTVRGGVAGGGAVDIGRKTLALKVTPRLRAPSGTGAGAVDFEVPLVIDGPWAHPRIYPDIAGILDDPGAAYRKLAAMGGDAQLRMAVRKAGPVVTDQGNLVLDVKFAGGISDPAALEAAINNLPGVLENGLFVNITDQVLVGEIVDGEPRVRDLVKG